MVSVARPARALQPLLTTAADAAARESGFVKRARKVRGANFVQALVFGRLGRPDASYGQLAQAGAACGLAISPQGLAQRFTEAAADCLKRVLEAALGVLLAAGEAAPIPLLGRFNGVYLSDSTTIALPDALAGVWAGCGGRVAANTQAGLKVQVRWEAARGRLEVLPLQAGRASDRAAGRAAPALPAGALRLVDLGYICPRRLVEFRAAGVEVLCRLPARPALFDAAGRRWEVGAFLAAQRADTVDAPVHLGAAERAPVRLAARRVAPELAARRRRHRRREARREGRGVSKARLALATWDASITTVPAARLTVEEALALARARWQVELLFRLWKERGRVAAWRSGKPWRIPCAVYAKLLALLIQHWCFLLIAWADPRRSLVKAAPGVRDHARSLALARGRAGRLRTALAALRDVLQHAGRVDRRRARPATADRLLALDPGQQDAIAAQLDAYGAFQLTPPRPPPELLEGPEQRAAQVAAGRPGPAALRRGRRIRRWAAVLAMRMPSFSGWLRMRSDPTADALQPSPRSGGAAGAGLRSRRRGRADYARVRRAPATEAHSTGSVAAIRRCRSAQARARPSWAQRRSRRVGLGGSCSGPGAVGVERCHSARQGASTRTAIPDGQHRERWAAVRPVDARRLTGAVPPRKMGRWGSMAQGAGPPREAGAETASTTSWRAFALVAAALVLGQGSLAPAAAALPLYLADLGAAPVRIGAEVGVANLIALGGTLLIGPVINRLGPQRLLRAGLGCYLVAALGLLALPGEAAVVACRAVQGCGAALVMPSALTLAPRLAPWRAGTALGALGALNNLAMAIGPPVGFWLYARGGAGGLFLPAVACAALGLAVGALVPRSPRAAAPARGFGYDRRWTPVLAANTLFLAYFGGIAAYLALALAHPGAPNAGLFFTADALGVGLLRTPAGALVDRHGPRPGQALGVLSTLGGLGLLAVTASAPTLLLAGLATGVGAGFFITGVLVSLAQRSGDHNRGTAMAMAGASLNGGLLAGGALAGPLYGAHGFGAVLLLGMTTTLAVLPLLLADRARAPRARAVG